MPPPPMPEPNRPRPGRPRSSTDELRRLQAIEAAERLFLANGFNASTMADIARSAGMSKKTIYTVFDSKDALLGAVLDRRFQPLTGPLDLDDSRPIEETLSALLLQAMTFILAPSEIRFLRLLVGDDQSNQVVAVMQRIGIFHETSTIGAWMTHQAARGTIEVEDPLEAADMLIGMGLGSLHIRLLVGAEESPTQAALAARAALVTRMFLCGSQQRRAPLGESPQ